MFIFTWLWPQLYYLFCVFSVVNIYKTLNKLSEIAFCNLSLCASRMRVTKGRGTLSHHVTVCVCGGGLLPTTVKDPGFQVYFSFSLSKSPAGLETHKGTPELSGEQLAQVLFTCNLSCVSVLFMFKSSSHQLPVDLEKLLFWRVDYYKKSWSLKENLWT